MSLPGVLVGHFPMVTSSLTCSLSRPSASPVPLAGSRSRPCVSARWSGISGCIANPTQDTVYEPKFCVNANDEHTPINLPDSNQTSPHDCNDTIAVTSEEPDVPRHSGASSCSKHTAVLRSPGNFLWKQLADYESVDSQNSIRDSGADLDRETVVSTLFQV